VAHLHRHHTASKTDPKVLHRKCECSAALQHSPSTAQHGHASTLGRKEERRGPPQDHACKVQRPTLQTQPAPLVLRSDHREHAHRSGRTWQPPQQNLQTLPVVWLSLAACEVPPERCIFRASIFLLSLGSRLVLQGGHPQPVAGWKATLG